MKNELIIRMRKPVEIFPRGPTQRLRLYADVMVNGVAIASLNAEREKDGRRSVVAADIWPVQIACYAEALRCEPIVKDYLPITTEISFKRGYEVGMANRHKEGMTDGKLMVSAEQAWEDFKLRTGEY